MGKVRLILELKHMKKKSVIVANISIGVLLQGCNIQLPVFSGFDAIYSYSDQKPVIHKKSTVIIAKSQARRFKVDLPLVLSVIHKESKYNITAVSPVGAQGLMQIMPATVQHINQSSPVHISSAFNPAQNIAGGTWYLKSLYNQFSQWPASERLKLTLASYNSGIGRVSKILRNVKQETGQSLYSIGWDDIASDLPAETQAYVPDVLKFRLQYQHQLNQNTLLF